jgi:hypothetical protein
MTTPSQILDEAGDETEACPECKGAKRVRHDEPGGRGSKPCGTCHGEGRVAEQPSTEVVGRVAKAIYEAARDDLDDDDVYRLARAALSAIPQPAEVVGPAWRDKPDAVGWWLRARVGDEPGWYLWSIRPHTKDKLLVATYAEVHDDFDRWFGPVRIAEDKAGA